MDHSDALSSPTSFSSTHTPQKPLPSLNTSPDQPVNSAYPTETPSAPTAGAFRDVAHDPQEMDQKRRELFPELYGGQKADGGENKTEPIQGEVKEKVNGTNPFGAQKLATEEQLKNMNVTMGFPGSADSAGNSGKE